MIILPDDVTYLLNILNRNGHQAFVVGGCVRDMLLGREPYDWDIATSASPPEIKKCFPHSFDTGIAHGTVTVVYGKRNYEVTTYRTDGVYSDGRRPDSVTFTGSLTEDLARRDFTMNAIAYHPAAGIVDPFLGKIDLQNKLIRCVGRPILRFSEDALRMLRAVRFSGQLGFTIERDTRRAIQKNAAGLRRVSVERVRDELTKLMLSPFSEKIKYISELGLIEYFPVDYPPTKQELEHAAQTLKNCSKKIILVYAVLFYNREPEFVLRSMRALRFDNNSVRDTSRLIKIAKSPIMNDDYNLRKFLSANQDLFNEVFELRRLFGRDEGDKPRRCTAIIANGDCLHVKDLCVNGKDLLNIGLNGKEIGDVLARMLDIVLRDPTLNTKDKLLRSVLKCSL